MQNDRAGKKSRAEDDGNDNDAKTFEARAATMATDALPGVASNAFKTTAPMTTTMGLIHQTETGAVSTIEEPGRLSDCYQNQLRRTTSMSCKLPEAKYEATCDNALQDHEVSLPEAPLLQKHRDSRLDEVSGKRPRESDHLKATPSIGPNYDAAHQGSDRGSQSDWQLQRPKDSLTSSGCSATATADNARQHIPSCETVSEQTADDSVSVIGMLQSHSMLISARATTIIDEDNNHARISGRAAALFRYEQFRRRRLRILMAKETMLSDNPIPMLCDAAAAAASSLAGTNFPGMTYSQTATSTNTVTDYNDYSIMNNHEAGSEMILRRPTEAFAIRPDYFEPMTVESQTNIIGDDADAILMFSAFHDLTPFLVGDLD